MIVGFAAVRRCLSVWFIKRSIKTLVPEWSRAQLLQQAVVLVTILKQVLPYVLCLGQWWELSTWILDVLVFFYLVIQLDKTQPIALRLVTYCLNCTTFWSVQQGSVACISLFHRLFPFLVGSMLMLAVLLFCSQAFFSKPGVSHGFLRDGSCRLSLLYEGCTLSLQTRKESVALVLFAR